MAERELPPSAKKLREAREKGNVALSRELSQSITLIMGLFLLGGPGAAMFTGFQDMLTQTLNSLSKVNVSTNPVVRESFIQNIIPVFFPVATLICGVAATSVMATLLQTNFLWVDKNVGLDFSKVKLNPLSFFQRVFSLNGFVELVKSILKMLMVGLVAYNYLNVHAQTLLGLAHLGVSYSVIQWSGLAFELAMQVAYAFLLIGILDYIYTRWNYDRHMKMTREEVKDEQTQSDGNPTIKNAIKGKQRQMAMMRMMSSVPRASVVITNPTHLAIAVEYDPSMRAPKVLAKGLRLVAERIIDVAKENKIPVVQNIPLAHAIYRSVEIDQEIPPDLYTAMAEVLIYVFRLRGTLNTMTSTKTTSAS